MEWIRNILHLWTIFVIFAPTLRSPFHREKNPTLYQIKTYAYFFMYVIHSEHSIQLLLSPKSHRIFFSKNYRSAFLFGFTQNLSGNISTQMNFITNSHFSYTVNKILILNRNSSASTFTFTAFNVAIRSIFFPTLHIQIVSDLNKLWRQRKQKYVNWRIFLSRVPQVVLIQNVCNLQMYCC